jgi:sugar O-acyltransferase (sialic acid O-acetyltransferase NeuD family)
MLRESKLDDDIVFFDRARDKPSFKTKSDFTNDVEQLAGKLREVTRYVVCIGAEHGYARVRTSDYLSAMGLKPLGIAHKRSFIDDTSEVGQGYQIMLGATVHKFTKIGKQAMLNTCCTVDHECTIGNGVHVMGAAAIAGRVQIGDFATIGTNATILPDIHIGEGAYVGAGAVVTKSVEPFSVVAGVPARVVRKVEPLFYEAELKRLAQASIAARA